MKMQGTDPAEDTTYGTQIRDRAMMRLMFWCTCCTNTLAPEEAGETEFLYQKLRISPQENIMVLWQVALRTHIAATLFLGLAVNT
jgi:hypothetical protein